MTRRYERRQNNDASANAEDGTEHPTTGELVTGVPITDGVPEGSPQLDVYKAEERKFSEANRLAQTHEPIENRDNRGNAIGDNDIPITKVDELSEEAVSSEIANVENVRSERNGNTLTVSATTRHGVSKASADVDKWSEGSVKKALKSIVAQMTGEEKPETDDPKAKLAESVREVAGRKD